MARKKKEEEEEIPAEDPVDTLSALELDEILASSRQKYFLSNLISRRAIELKRGARALVDLRGPHTHLELALAEAQAGMLKVRPKRTVTRMVNLADEE